MCSFEANRMGAVQSSWKLGATHLVLQSDCRGRSAQTLTPSCLENSWLGSKHWVQPYCGVSRLSQYVSVYNRRSLASTVCFILPTAKPERVSSGI